MKSWSIKHHMWKCFKSNKLGCFCFHNHHQFQEPAVWRRWVRMNVLHCPRSFVKVHCPLNAVQLIRCPHLLLLYSGLKRLLQLRRPFYFFPSSMILSSTRLCRLSFPSKSLVSSIDAVILQFLYSRTARVTKCRVVFQLSEMTLVEFLETQAKSNSLGYKQNYLNIFQ